MHENVATELLLHELFFSGYLKGVLKKPVNDPYDIDLFLMSLSQKHIFPMEIKEKFPGQNPNEFFFGIDAGRIMMLLRICIPNDSNAIYLIRQVEEGTGRFIAWKYMLLSDIIMTAGWNLQAGGRGMGGQDTQTIKLPYDDFRVFDTKFLSEDYLKEISSLPNEVKNMAKKFEVQVSGRFYRGGKRL